MEKPNSQIEHGQPMEQTRGLFCMCDVGVAHCQPQHQYHLNEFDVQRLLYGQVSLAAVIQIMCNS